MPVDPSERLLSDLRRANGDAFPALDEADRPTWGDVLDVALGGPRRFVCPHCTADPPEHRVCLGMVGGRTCQCADGPHPLRRR
jgi:hypothetical protein